MPSVIPEPILTALGILEPFGSQRKLYYQVSKALHDEYYYRLTYHFIEPDTNALVKMAKHVNSETRHTLISYLRACARRLTNETIEQNREQLKMVADPTDTNRDAAEGILHALETS